MAVIEMKMPYPDTRPTLLLVDDEPANLHVLRQILEADYRLLFARDGQRALSLAHAQQPDLILLDVMMPGMTGLEVCRQLKNSPHTVAIPVIFVTALSDTDDESRGFEAGCVDYITKPVSPPIVRARVRTHLSLVRVEELRESRLQIVQRLGLAAEYKDNETGLHVIRMSHYCQILARAAGFPKPRPKSCSTQRRCMTSARSAYPMPSCASGANWTHRSGLPCSSMWRSAHASSASTAPAC